MASSLRFTISYAGRDADQHLIDFYDIAQALVGFERSLALTTHLALSGKVITHAPALKGARIFAQPAEDSSWKIAAIIAVSAGLYNVGTADRQTPLGHLVHSLYDYVISESLGVHVDYDKSLGQLYEDGKAKDSKAPVLKQSQADSLIEKCQKAIKDMHRPIVGSESASRATIVSEMSGKPQPLNTELTTATYEYIFETRRSNVPVEYIGRVTSYNSNTYKGRFYSPEIGRPVPFELAPAARKPRMLQLLTASLQASALKNSEGRWAFLRFTAYVFTSRSGQIKWMSIVHIADASS